MVQTRNAMSLFVDEKYLNSIAHKFRNFHKKSDYLWNFSCPICGDSKKNKLKARGYMLRGKNGLVYKCHNCGCAYSFGEFLRNLDNAVYKEYVYESFLEANPKEESPLDKVKKKLTKVKAKKEYKPAKPTALVGCPSIATLGPDHPARAYIEYRQIPSKFYHELFWTDDFPALMDKIL
jgi:transcription elongation factor Elf1